MSKMTIEGGNQVWRNKAGKCHREDGPAYIGASGHQAWWQNGKLHRLDGPAIIHKDGKQEWCFNHFYVTKQVTDWIKENDFPDYALWTDSHKIMFKLAFSGKISS